MTEEVASLIIKADSTQLKSARDELDKLAKTSANTEDAVSKFSSEVDRGFSVAKTAAVGLATVFAGISVSNIIREVSSLSQTYGELGIAMHAVGRNAGLSAQEIDSVAKAVQKSGISMIESRSVISRLITANIDLAKATQLARTAQDAAVIGQINSSEALDRMVHGIIAAEVEVLRGIGINVSFENSYKAMAEQLGITTAQLSEQQKMQARVNVVLEEGAKNAGVYEAAMNNAGKQLRSTERIIEDMKVKVGGLFDSVTLAAVQTYSNTLKEIDSVIAELVSSGQIERWGDNIARVFAFILDSGRAVITIFKTIGFGIATAVEQAAAVLTLNFQRAIDLGSSFNKMMAEEFNALTRNRDAVEAQIKARKEMASSTDSVAQAVKKDADGSNAASESLKKLSDTQRKIVSDRERFIASLSREASQLGKTNSEIKRMEAAQLGVLATATPLIDRVDAYNRSLRDQEIRVDSITKNLQRYQSITESVLTDQEKYDLFVQQLNEAKNATDGTAISQETYNRALKKAEEQFLKTGDAGRRALDEISQFAIQAQRNLQNALGDALFDGIDGRFGDMVDGFTRALKQMLAQALAADIWGALFNKRTGNMAALFGSLGLTGNAAASGGSSIGGMLDIASLGSSAASMFSTGLGATNLLGGALSSIGGMFGSGSTAAFGAGFAGDLIGGVAAGVEAGMSGAAAASAASMGSTIGAVAGPAIALAAVDMIGRFLAGNKSTGTFVDSVPVIGGFAGALFGRGPLKQKETNLIGTATSEGFDGITSTKFKAEGGLFRSDKIKRVESELSLEFETLLDSAITGFSDSLSNIADTLGLSKDAIDNFSQSINIATEKGKDFTDEQIAELIADIGQNMSEQLLPAVGELRNAGETAFQTLQRLGSEFNVLTNLGSALGNSLADTRAFLRGVSFEQRSAFVEAAGGLDALSANANFFAENFLSDAERLQPSIELLNEEMAKLGLSAEISKSQFRDLVMSFGQTNGISEEMLQGLLGVQHLFVRVKDGLAALNPELRAAADATFDLAAAEALVSDKRSALIAAYSREKSALENVASRFSDLAANLRNSSASLSLGNLSPLTPQQRLEEARRQFNLDRVAANAGDQEALRRLPESGRAFLEASQVFNASSAEFVSDFNLVKQVLDSAAVTAETEADIARKQLSQLEDSIGRLVDINDSVKDVETAIKELTAAVLQGGGNPSISDQAIRDFINTPGRSTQDIIDAAVKFGVSGSQIAGALDVDQSVINKAAGGQSVSDQAIKDFVSANINDPMAIYNAAIANGISSQRLAAVTGINIDDINNFVRMNGLAAFKEGTDFVPHDGLAMLHKGEAVTPSSLVTEVKALRLELAELRREQNQQTGALINVAVESQRMNANMIIQSNQDAVKSAAWREQAKAVVR